MLIWGVNIKDEGEQGKVLLVDSDLSVIDKLKAIAEESGYDVSTLFSLKRIDESIAFFKLIGFDLIAVSSHAAHDSPGAVYKLRKALDCPVIIYTGGPLGELSVKTFTS